MMDTKQKLTAKQLEAASRALISASVTNLGFEVQMPVVYQNGQCVSVVVSVAGGNYIVHDAGFGAMYLTGAGIDLTKSLSKKLKRLADEYGCEFVDGRMSRACTDSQLPIAIAFVANASRAVGDQVFEQREKSYRDFRRQVSRTLEKTLSEDRVRRKQVVGGSGTLYRVSHVILSADKSRELAFVEPIPDQQTVDRKFREFFDIRASEEYKDIERIAVYDDRESWRDGDLLVLRNVSTTVPFARLQRRIEKLAA